MDALDLLRSHVARPEPIPLTVDYSALTRTPQIDRLIFDECFRTNTIYGAITDGRFHLYISREHDLLDGITLRVVPYLGQPRPGESFQGMHMGNGHMDMLHNAAPGTMAHEFMHVIIGNGHHEDAEGVHCIRNRYLGPTKFCEQDIREIRKKLGL